MKSETEYTIDNKYTFSTDNIIHKSDVFDIFSGFFIENDFKNYIAVKCEKHTNKQKTLEYEAKIYDYLNQQITEDEEEYKTIPSFYHFSKRGSKSYLIIEQLGHNLSQIFSLSKNKFQHQSVFLILLQMLKAIKFLHSKSIVHRNIRPENFLYERYISTMVIVPGLEIGNTVELSPKNKLYLINYANSGFFEDPKTKKHISCKTGINSKNIRFGSTWSLLGLENSRRDDLDSLNFILLFLLKGSLPWDKVKGKTKREVMDFIIEKKLSLSPTEMYKDVNVEECIKFAHYIRGLQFEDEPNYNFMENLIISALKRINYREGEKSLYMIRINEKEEDEEENKAQLRNKNIVVYSAYLTSESGDVERKKYENENEQKKYCFTVRFVSKYREMNKLKKTF